MSAVEQPLAGSSTKSGAVLEVDQISKVYASSGHPVTAISEVSFQVAEREFVSVVGPSGCGKTTLLKCISGLLSPSSGQTTVRGRKVTSPPPDMAIVFQDYSRSLLPWMTVRKNVALPLLKHKTRAERDQICDQALAEVNLAAFADKYPWQLSGGMQQRVAIARALAYEPRVLLLDEPFASVDAQTRAELEDLVVRLRTRYAITTLLVTHDIDEAVYMADRVIVLTRQPSTVLEVLPVDLPYPRDQIDTKALPEFSELRGHLYRQIMEAHREVGANRTAPEAPATPAEPVTDRVEEFS